MYTAVIMTKKQQRVSKCIECESKAMLKLFLLQNVKTHQIGFIAVKDDEDYQIIFEVEGNGYWPKVVKDIDKANA